MGPRAGLDRCGKSRPTGIRSPDRLARSSVAIPTELPGPHLYLSNHLEFNLRSCEIFSRDDRYYHLPKYLPFPLNRHAYTGCNRRNGPDFGMVFLMLNYTENPQNTYIQSSMVTEI